MASSLDESAFSAYNLWEPRPISSHIQQPPNTFDFKVILIGASDLFHTHKSINQSISQPTNQSINQYSENSSVYLQLRVLDHFGHAIAPHFTYTSTVQTGPSPVWRESVLLKHLPTRPCQLQFKFYVKSINQSTDQIGFNAEDPGEMIGEVTVPNQVLTHFYGDCSLIYSAWHRLNQSINQSSNQSINPSAQFHYVITPPQARLRHLTSEQANPPMLPQIESIYRSISQPVDQSVNQSVNQSNSQSVSQSVDQSLPKQPLVVRTVSLDSDVSQIPIISTRQKQRTPSPQPASQSISQSTSQPIGQPISQPINQSISQPIRNGGAHTTNTSIDMGSPIVSHPITSPSTQIESINPLTSPSLHPSINQPIVLTPYELLCEKEKTLTAEEKSKRDSMRERACSEFLNTERSYVTNLAILKNEFVDPLIECVRNGQIDMKPEMLTTIVNNIETLHAFHIQFLGELEQKNQSINQSINHSTNQSASQQPINQSINQPMSSAASIATTFNKYSQFFKLYISYVNQYEASLSAINSLRSNKPFQHFLTAMRDRLNEISILDLTSYLITPVQRVPRYVMLLNEIAKHTGPQSLDYTALQTALDAVKRVAAYVNESKRECENISKLVDVQERISGDRCPQLVAPARRFVCEAEMERVSHSILHTTKLKTAYFFLFNDLIVWANVNHAFKGSIQLVTASLDIKQKDKLILDITSAKHHLSMKFPNLTLYNQWSEMIQSLIDELQRERNKNRVLYRDLKSRRRQMNGINQLAESGSPSPSADPADLHHAINQSINQPMHEDDNVHSLITEKLRQLQMNKGDSQFDLNRESSMYSLNRRVSFAPINQSINQSIDTPGLMPSDSFDYVNDDPSVSPPSGPAQSAGVLLHHHRQSQILRSMKSDQSINQSINQSMSQSNQPPLLHTSSLLNPPVAIPPPMVTNLCLCLDRAEGKNNSMKMFGDGVTQRCPLHSLPDAL